MTEFNYQLYSSRNHGPLGETLRMLAKAGYAGVEGYGALYAGLDDAALSRLRQELDGNRLNMPTGHFDLDMLEGDPDRSIKVARALGVRTVYGPFLPPDERPRDAEGWAAFGKRLNKIGQPILDAGLAFGWHNHDFEFVTLADGSRPIEHIFGAAPNLEWEADIAWIARGGADPDEWIDKYGDRITAVHVKDIAPKGENADEDGWADVGHGTLAWKELMDRLRQTNAAYFIVEHDKPGDDERFATRSIAAARKF